MLFLYEMLKILRNKNNKDNSLIELNLFDNPFYFLHDNKQCEHFSTYIEDFKDGICRFCKNLPLIEVNPQKRIKKVIIDKHLESKVMKKIFSWQLPKDENKIFYTLYKVNFITKEITDNFNELFIILCNSMIKKEYIQQLQNNLNNKFIIISITYKEIEKEEIIAFSVYQDNFSNLNITDYKYKDEDLNNIVDLVVDENYLEKTFFSIIIKSFVKVNLLENIILKDKMEEIDAFFKKYYKKFSHIRDILSEIETFTTNSHPQIYIQLICESERHKFLTTIPFFYFFQNEIKNRINESKSIEGYIALTISYIRQQFFRNIGFSPYYDINNKFYKNVNDLIQKGILKENENTTFMVSINLAEEYLKIGSFENLIINE